MNFAVPYMMKMITQLYILVHDIPTQKYIDIFSFKINA